MRARRVKPSPSRFELLQQRDALARKLERRSETEKALLDNDPAMLLVLVFVAAIWALELSANLVNPTGWSGTAHLLLVGSLEVMVFYCLFAAVRASWIRRRIRRLDQCLQRMTSPAFSA